MEKTRNIGASKKAQLLYSARKRNIDYNALLRRYFQERFLYRLSISPYKNNFILKGALTLTCYNISEFRTTRDIDLMGISVKTEIEDLKFIITEIADIDSDDGVKFDSPNLRTEAIKGTTQYGGIRVHLPYSMDTIQGYISVDIGFGDKIIAGPVETNFPVILDSPIPQIRAYSLESVIAEKFEAIVKLNVLTSRMKDFYDILFIASIKSFDSNVLNKAIVTTFQNRNTDILIRSKIFEESFTSDKFRQRQWQVYNNKINNKNFPDFASAIQKIKSFIEPIMDFRPTKKWNPQTWQWE